jgi:hypothetical protein
MVFIKRVGKAIHQEALDSSLSCPKAQIAGGLMFLYP